MHSDLKTKKAEFIFDKLRKARLDALKLFFEFASNEKASRREVSFHAKKLLETLKKAGLA